MDNIKQIPGHQGKYFVSSDGKVFSKASGKMIELKPQKGKHGYNSFYLYGNEYTSKLKGRKIRAHRLVASSFLENPNNFEEVNHKNGIKTDNRVENLEWCNRSQNIQHAYRINLLSKKGEKHSNHKLKNEQIEFIVNNYTGKHGEQKELAKKFNVSKGTISMIINSITWTHLDLKNGLKLKRKIFQFTTEMNLIRKWDSIAEAVKQKAASRASGVDNCISYRIKTHNGCIWRRENDPSIQNIISKINNEDTRLQ